MENQLQLSRREYDVADNRWRTLRNALNVRDVDLVKAVMPLIPDLSKRSKRGDHLNILASICLLDDYDLMKEALNLGANDDLPDSGISLMKIGEKCFEAKLRALDACVLYGRKEALRALMDHGYHPLKHAGDAPLGVLVFSSGYCKLERQLEMFDYLVSLGVDMCKKASLCAYQESEPTEFDLFDIVSNIIRPVLEEKANLIFEHLREKHPDIWEKLDGDARNMEHHLASVANMSMR